RKHDVYIYSPSHPWEPQLALYVIDTLTYIGAVKDFCAMFPGWKTRREKQVKEMRKIKEKADKIHPSKGKKKNILKIMNKFKFRKGKELAELEKELDEVLKETLKDLKKLNTFLDAVEKLAVTSLQVFTENQILILPEGISFDQIQDLIKSAQLTCPLILEFKREAKAFFAPKIPNMEVLLYRLRKHICTSEKIYKNLSDRLETRKIKEQACFCVFLRLNININREKMREITVECNLSDDDLQKMTDQAKQLDKIRMDDDFRMMFLFQKRSYTDFVNMYNDQLPEMLQFLDQIEQCAVKLDRMDKKEICAKLAESAGGVAEGILSIISSALIPGGRSGGVLEKVDKVKAVVKQQRDKSKHKKEANEAFNNFMVAVEKIQNCLEEEDESPSAEVTQSSENVQCTAELHSARKKLKLIFNPFVGSCKKVLKNVASDPPDFAKAAVQSSVGSIVLNVLFIGMDIFFIAKDSVALAKGTETMVSKFLRDRAALWRSEIAAWEKICNSLCRSKLTAEENREMLEKPFYPI
uniref:Uncharacterized protein n=1 Tax=Poecilia formosa TaxID=48698 RepID=A0A096MCS3_POEFO